MKKQISQRFRSALVIAGAVLLLTLIVGAIWGWAGALSCLIGVTIFVIVVLTILRAGQVYLSEQPLKTFPYAVNPLFAVLYSFIDPQSRYQPKGTKKEEELPPFHFKEENGESRENK